MRAALLGAFVVLLAGCASQTPPPVATPTAAIAADGEPGLRLVPFADGFVQPLLLTHDGEPGIVYVVEQGGRVLRVQGDSRTVWLDVRSDTMAGGERGLLGLAFEREGDRAYVSYTDHAGDSVLERIHANGTRERLLLVDQPYGNHNGGHLTFGPDGWLYYGLGDGGSAGDPQGNGQDPDALLGSLLRLDVSGESGYAIPDGNPWKEVWAKGLRNPWRFTFDRETGDLYIGDVGQNEIEEINMLPHGSPGGANFGWSAYEGTQRYGVLNRAFSEVTFPVAEYTHADGCSVTGGHVYRGEAQPALVGAYFLADYCSGKIWGLREIGGTWKLVELLDTEHRISSFGEDAAGELYVIDHAGSILRIEGDALPAELRPRAP